jgi:hypothetical protein
MHFNNGTCSSCIGLFLAHRDELLDSSKHEIQIRLCVHNRTDIAICISHYAGCKCDDITAN